MLERATDDIIALAAAAAAAVVTVVAAAFALYAACLSSHMSPAWSAAVVSAAAAAIVGILYGIATLRARAKQRAAEDAQAELARQLPINVAGLARDHPFAALAVSVVGGALAARHPKLARDLLSLVTRFSSGGRS